MQKTAKILINALLLYRCSGGYKSYFINVVIPLLDKLNKENYTAKVLLFKSSYDTYEKQLNKNWCIIDGKNAVGFKRMVYEKRIVAKLIKKHSFTTVFTPYQIGPTPKNIKSILMFRNMEPYIASMYSYPIKNKLRSLLLRLLGKQNLQKADQVIAVSEFTREFTVNNIMLDPNKIKVIPHGITSKKNPLHNKVQDKDIILSVGSMMPYRRYEDVILAFEKFKYDHQNNTQLILVGGGSDDAYRTKINNLVRECKFKNDILIKGKLPHEEVIKLYLQSKIFIMSSEIEACPNTALEAMAYACCIISSKNKPMPEFFDHAALYYAKRDVDQLYNCIDTCYQDAEQRKKMKRLAFERSKRYTWGQTLDKTYNLLKESHHEN